MSKFWQMPSPISSLTWSGLGKRQLNSFESNRNIESFLFIVLCDIGFNGYNSKKGSALHKWSADRVDQAGVICKQEGIFRVNCMDCLDRTNVVQAAIARVVMEQQVSNMYFFLKNLKCITYMYCFYVATAFYTSWDKQSWHESACCWREIPFLTLLVVMNVYLKMAIYCVESLFWL